jgi:hypothetical protein
MIKKATFSVLALLLVFALFTPASAGAVGPGVDSLTAKVCSGEKLHPGLVKLGTIFNIEDEDLLTYFCMGYDIPTLQKALRDAFRSGTTLDEELGIDPVDTGDGEDWILNQGEKPGTW